LPSRGIKRGGENNWRWGGVVVTEILSITTWALVIKKFLVAIV